MSKSQARRIEVLAELSDAELREIARPAPGEAGEHLPRKRGRMSVFGRNPDPANLTTIEQLFASSARLAKQADTKRRGERSHDAIVLELEAIRQMLMVLAIAAVAEAGK